MANHNRMCSSNVSHFKQVTSYTNLPVRSSNTRIPKDQKSTLKLWPLLRMISGATYSGVPQKVQVFWPHLIFLAKPKSTWEIKVDPLISKNKSGNFLWKKKKKNWSSLACVLVWCILLNPVSDSQALGLGRGHPSDGGIQRPLWRSRHKTWPWAHQNFPCSWKIKF